MCDEEDNWSSVANAQAYEKFTQTFGMYERLSRALLSTFVDTSKITKACDLGCGTGVSTLALKKFLNHRADIFGFDSSSAMLNIARGKSDLATVNFLDALPSSDTQFDLIFSNASFWQFKPDEQKQWLTNTLKPGGRIVYNVPVELKDNSKHNYLFDFDGFKATILNEISEFTTVYRTYQGSTSEAVEFLKIPIFKRNATPLIFHEVEFFDADWAFICATRS
jgi:trans-aconitate methyltransferase